jgi:phosphoribosyl-ATP pyrophosphohydrolase
MTIQQKVGDWHRSIYPICTNEKIARKYWEEALELRMAIADNTDWQEEAADVVIVLMSLCDRNGVDLMAEVSKKLEVVRNRGLSQRQRDLERGV